MRYIIILVLLTGVLAFLVWQGAAQQQNPTTSSNAGPERSVHKNTIISLSFPPIRIEVSEQLSHVGILNFTLKNVAPNERYESQSPTVQEDPERNRDRRLHRG